MGAPAFVFAVIAAALGGGGIGGIAVARIGARSAVKVAETSKPHELVEASAHAISAFMASAQDEIERLHKAQAMNARRLDECETKHDATTARLERCEEAHRVESETNEALRGELAITRARVAELEETVQRLHPGATSGE